MLYSIFMINFFFFSVYLAFDLLSICLKMVNDKKFGC